jgi:3'(2'), 5'-bisphosphate nucleotidase
VEKIWDHAAGWMLVTASGGTVTDAEGNPLDFAQGYRLEKNRGVVASRGVDHDRLIQAVQETLSTV